MASILKCSDGTRAQAVLEDDELSHSPVSHSAPFQFLILLQAMAFPEDILAFYKPVAILASCLGLFSNHQWAQDEKTKVGRD